MSGGPATNTVRILTAAGASALAAVRFSGPAVREFLEQRFSKPTVVGRCVHGELRDDQGVIDDPVCVLNRDGSVDVTLHGNPWIVDLVLTLARTHGFAEGDATGRGEKRTIDDDIEDALPHVRTERAARTLLAQREAWSRADPRSWTDAERAAIASDRSLFHLLHPPTVAIVGLPNAGKSTLANALFGQRRSIVSDVAGTTRDWVGELADLGGLVVTLVDTPGLRETPDAIEREAIARSATPVAAADVVVVLLDATRDDADQRSLAARFDRPILAANKTDVAAAPPDAIPLVARDGVGVDRLIAAIHDRLGLNDRPIDAPRVWTARQLDALR